MASIGQLMKIFIGKIILYSANIRNPEVQQLRKKYCRDIPGDILEYLAGLFALFNYHKLIYPTTKMPGLSRAFYKVTPLLLQFISCY